MVESATRTVVFVEPVDQRLCLGFVNTMHNYDSNESRDELKSYSHLVSWSQEVGIVNSREAQQLLRESTSCPRDAAAVLKQALALRDVIYRIFSAIASQHAPEAADLDSFNADLSKVLKHSQVVSMAEGFAWGWEHREMVLDWMLWPVVRSAADLLTSDDLYRVRECGGDSCTWLFMDMSRNQSRRWCDMKGCGNRAKARRHYERTRTHQKKQTQ